MKKIIRKVTAKQQGSILLLALFVLGAMMIVGLGTASLSLNQIKQTREIRKSTMAFYAAEAGIEEGLYRVRKNEQDVTTIQATLNDFSESANANYVLTGQDYETVVYDHLNVNEIVSLDVYDINNLNNGLNCLRLEWDGKPASWLEVTWKSFKPGVFLEEEYFTQKRVVAYNESGNNTESVDLDLKSTLDDYYLHSVQVKALYDEVKNLRLSAYPTSIGNSCQGEQGDIASRLYLSAVGEYPVSADPLTRAKQNLTVTLPEKTPLSPLFDYVIFSEENLEKTILHTASVQGHIIFVDCGVSLTGDDCKHEFNQDPSEMINPYIQNIGIATTTVTDSKIIDENPPGVFEIVHGFECERTFSFNEECQMRIMKLRSVPGAWARLSVATTSAVTMYLYQPLP